MRKRRHGCSPAGHRPSSPCEEELDTALGDAFKRLISPSISAEILGDLKARSEDAAIDVFAQNLRNLLLASPAGTKPVIGLDPGLRTGCKTVALGATGRFIENRTLYIVGSDADKARAGRDLLEMVERHSPFAVVIGNGTGGREAQAFVKTTLAQTPHSGLIVLQVSEAGASIYSASDVARLEFPDLDLTVRGAISIGRRFQDPLAELVKLDPKAIGVGQYQHDVNQSALQRKLSEVVEDCVNQVGVALNTASAQLLAHVAGIGPKLAQNIVAHREDTGPFSSRRDLLSVPKLGKKTFEQAAGFLRISGGKEPLDASSVHPERYALVKRMAADVGTGVGALLGDPIKADRIPLEPYLDSGVGAPTLRDIIAELKKPGRDPRATFEAPSFRQDIHSMKDLKAGMHFEGVVTNVTAFGAFVDIGVHQDGLVHISQLADSFVRDPHQVVHVGQAIKVSVLEVDLRRGRISLSARSNQKARSRA